MSLDLIIIQFSFLCVIFAFVVILYVQLNETTNTLSQLQRSFEKYVQTNISNSTNGSSSALTQTDLNNAISGLLISITSQIGSVNSSINLMLNEPKKLISGVNYPTTFV
jgi:predicted PurR-regulated permease PerM